MSTFTLEIPSEPFVPYSQQFLIFFSPAIKIRYAITISNNQFIFIKLTGEYWCVSFNSIQIFVCGIQTYYLSFFLNSQLFNRTFDCISPICQWFYLFNILNSYCLSDYFGVQIASEDTQNRHVKIQETPWKGWNNGRSCSFFK